MRNARPMSRFAMRARGALATSVALCAAALILGVAPAQAQDFQKTQLVDTTLNPMEIEVAPDGTVFYTERRGVVGVWDPDTESAREIGTVPVTTFQENGLMGIALAPDYETSGWIYLSYSALPLEELTQRLSRFQLDDETGDLDMDSEQAIFEWTHLRETCCHSAGALEFDPDGNLLISTGDNTNPFDSNGFTPIDEREGRESWDAQRTSANTNDHNGKLLRITPEDGILPGTEPGIGTTYEIPEGNMFGEDADPLTLPEIHSMGFRNPFRFKVDEETGWTLLADYGPDAGAAMPDRGPQGTVEFNVIQEPINSGWPYCVREDTPYIDGEFTDPNNTFVSSEVPFDCENPVNDSPNNTGHTNLPSTFPATMWQSFTETDPRYPGLGTNGAPMSGPRYYYDAANPSATKFPEEFDGKWFIASWNNDWIRTVDLDSEGTPSNVQNFPSLPGPEGPGYLSPMDMEFGPDGSLYLAEWGNANPFDLDHPDSGIYRIDHVELTGPQVTAAADPESGTVPLEVAFDGEATDPDGEPNPSFEYEWDFGDGNSSTDQDPVHTYTETGTFEATLTVTDPDTEEEGSDTVEIRVNPEDTCPTGPRSDEFEGTEIDPKWTIIRPDDTRPPTVSDGELHFPIDNGSIFGAGTSARNIVVQPLPSGEVTVTAKLSVDELSENYHQAGLRVYSDDNNWASVHMIHAGGQRDIEFIWEANGVPRNDGEDKLGGIPSDAPLEYYVRLISDGSELTAEYSYDGETFEPVGRPGSLATFDNPRVGPVALSDAATTYPVAHFDWIRFDPDASSGGGDANDQFDGDSLDTERWNAIVNENPDAYEVAGGELTITTEPGDIYTGDTVPPPNNFILQSADHAGSDWTMETKLSATIDGSYSQGGLIAMQDTDNYVKFDPISDEGQTQINRIELRSEVGGAIQDPQPQFDVPAGTTDVWLRLSKTGEMYSGEYSLDGEMWTAFPEAVSNPMAAPDFGLFAIGVNQGGDTVSFDYFTLDGEDPCVCVGASDEFEGDALDKDRWNEIVREDESLYSVENGALVVTTTDGDIYQDGDPALTRNFFLQSPDHAGADWQIETKLAAGELSGGYEHAGLMAYSDDDNYIKYDVISDDGQAVNNRIELRSEVGGAIQNPQPQVTSADPEGFPDDVWLRLTKEGDMYTGEYSFDGETWEELPEGAVPNGMAAPRFGLFTQGVNSPGATVEFEYFALDGDCPPGGDNNPPTVDEISADPTGGFAPLDVDFTASASDPDEDELSYSWDFDGDGTEDSTEQNPSHTYTEAGEFDAELTVSDGEAQDTETVSVSVFGEDDPSAELRTLVFSKTQGFEHASIPAGHDALEQLGEDNGIQVDHTKDASLFRPDVLARYDTITFLSTTGDVLNAEQQAAFEDYIQSGGGYVGIHSASDTEYEWNWYGHLVGAYFISHPPGTANAAIDVEDHDHASTAGLPDRYQRVDEWYNFKSPDFAEVGDADYTPRDNVHVLATVDEATYDEQDGSADADDHPMTWCQRYDGGFSWYTAMGHTNESFTEDNFLTQVLGGLRTTAGVEPSATCGVEGGEPQLRVKVKPKKKTIGPNKRKTAFRFRVRNTGDAATGPLTLCAKAPRKRLRVVGKSCRKTQSLAPKAATTQRFKFKVKRKARGKTTRIRFVARGKGVQNERAVARLRVKR